jgi:hypothetical protein
MNPSAVSAAFTNAAGCVAAVLLLSEAAAAEPIVLSSATFQTESGGTGFPAFDPVAAFSLSVLPERSIRIFEMPVSAADIGKTFRATAAGDQDFDAFVALLPERPIILGLFQFGRLRMSSLPVLRISVFRRRQPLQQ